MTADEDNVQMPERCRGCLGNTDLVAIKDDIQTKFFEITSIMVTREDGMPSCLCLDCLDTLNYATQFKNRCLRIDNNLRKLVAKKAIKISTDTTKDNVQRSNSSELGEETKKVESIIKRETDSGTDDDDGYYVVIINENSNGEKLVQTVKVENDAGELDVNNIKTEHIEVDADEADEEEEGEYFPNEDTPQEGIAGETSRGSANEERVDDNQIAEIQLRDLPMQIAEDDARLSLMHVLSSNRESIEGNIIQYSEDGVSIVGEVIPEGMSESEDAITNLAYAEQEVVVDAGDGEFEIVCDPNMDDEEETIAVMQQPDGSFLCDCGLSFMDFQDFREHSAIHNVFTCAVCNRGFESQEIVEGHTLLHTSAEPILSCPFCRQLVKRNMITTHIKINHNQARPECNICEKTFANHHNLRRHMVIHSGEKHYECDICGRRFNQKASMQSHRLLHTRDIEIKCSLCQATFETQEDLNTHREGLCEPTSIPKQFYCSTCGKQYTNVSSLRNHIEYAHNNAEVELLCSECGEVLPSRKAMYAHAYTHRQTKTKNQRRFACRTCGKGCSSHAMLLMHERVHTNERPYKCTKCTLAFKTKTHLTTHQLTHTQEKRFGCSVCMKFFALKGNLVVHLRTHTGERPYVCSICNQAFIDSKYLKKHKQRRHDIANIPWNQYY